MIDSDLQNFIPDLREVENLFNGGELKIRHRFSMGENKLVNTVTVNGQTYAYGNIVPEFTDKTVEKRYIKRYAKLSLYKALSKFTGKDMPWGALTGIRPTKLAYQQMEETGEFEDFFINVMKVSENKTDLTKKVINSQKGYYEKNDLNTDFFVFIPFCPSRCKYCSFISADIKHASRFVDDYVDSLIEEIRASAPLIKKLRSIYIGGGTPVALPNDKLTRVLKEIDIINSGVEYTVEAGRPDAINAENLAILKDFGVTRICVNPQTFSDKTLTLLGRNHTAKDVFTAYDLAKKDFAVNMDLIAGLSGEKFSDFQNSLDTAISLNPENITVHTLCVKKGSYLAEETDRLPEGEVENMVEYSHKTLQNAGYSPYYLYRQKYMAGNLENTGYAKDGKVCVYNIDVMEEIAQNVSCGANAVTKRVFNGGERIERIASPKDIQTYLNKSGDIIQNKLKFFE
ncbi:MAG: coproporphyrinogen dehydrogenase HemZ [Clostridia bacterium]|nr:coproporphyrinogen dehydrogenase HemZ [Clostridia bacterium]